MTILSFFPPSLLLWANRNDKIVSLEIEGSGGSAASHPPVPAPTVEINTMALSLQLVQKLSQRLIMTPQMQQSIQLLQMNTLELEQMTQEELLENPFLQLEEDRGDGDSEQVASPESAEASGADGPSSENAPETGGDGDAGSKDESSDDIFTPIEAEVTANDSMADMVMQASVEAPSANGSEAPGASETATTDGVATDGLAEEGEQVPAIADAPEQFSEVDVNWEEFYEGGENRTYIREAPEETTDFTEYTALKESLYDYLMWQLRLCVLEGKDAEIGEYLIGCMDEDGFLDAASLDEAAEKFEVEGDVVSRVLEILQEFEPTGVAARTSAESLIIQMKALGSYSEAAAEIVENHFESLQRKKFREIARDVGIEEKEVTEIFYKVSRLEPKPGRSHTKDSAQYITPDVVVKIIDGELSFYLNEGSTGQLSINRLYRRLLRMQRNSLTKEEKEYAADKFRNALMLIKNIEKRKSTILRVTESIMEVQRTFLDKGVEALKPLTLREVADMVGMHESTIARVTSKKFVDTPQGLFRLKYFFSSGIKSTNMSGTEVSSRAIKDKLAGYIEDEDPKRPLSDQKIAETLNAAGYSIARRTVAKYREQLKILPAKLRREA